MSSNGVLKPTSGRQWRKLREEGFLYELPSGNTARLRPISLIDLWKMKRIPDHLTELVVEIVTRSRVDAENAIGKAMESMNRITELYDIVCTAAFVEPKVVDVPTADDEISVDDVTSEDKQAVLVVCSSPSVALESFRQEQAANAETVQHGKNVRTAPQPVDGRA